MSRLAGWRRCLALIAVAPLLGLAAPAGAQALRSEEPGGGMMLFDMIFVRPVGLAATVVGTAAFIVSLPFTVVAGDVNEAGKTLVRDPFLYTFERPLGETERRE